MATEIPTKSGRLSTAYGAVVTWLRFLLFPAALALAVYVGVQTSPQQAGESDVISMIPPDSKALEAQRRAAELFDLPFASDAVVVQRNPSGLSLDVQKQTVDRAVATDRAARDRTGPAMVAIPVANTRGLVPGSRESDTTALTYLGFPPSTPLVDRVALADQYAGRVGPDVVGVTGVAPANLHEGQLIEDSLIWIELATVALVLLVVGLLYRSILAPLLALVAVGASYTLAVAALRWLGGVAGFHVPENLRPLMVALVLGVVTDYSIFYMSCLRAKLSRGEERLDSAKRATAEITPIILASGLILSAGLAALKVSSIPFFSDLGPGLALTVLVSMAVSIVIVPAAMALFGRALYWPAGLRDDRPARRGAGRLASFMVRKPVAALVAVVCIAGLGYGAVRAFDARLGFSPIDGLPASSEERRAADAAEKGFAAGMIAPTQIVLERDGLEQDRAKLVDLARRVGQEPGVAAVISSGMLPDVEGADIAFSSDGSAGRMLVVFGSDPHGATAIDDLDRLEGRMPALLEASGIGGTRVSYAGDTALASESVDTMLGDTGRIAVAVLAINLLLLALYLRALVAPLFLVAASALAVLAALGVTWIVIGELFGYGQLTYLVPFAAGVLLVSLGSDYNVFLTGRVWQEAALRPLDEAIAVAAPRASRAIRSAGLTLAASFALLALVPVRVFREFALAMVVGVVLETFVIRSLLTPALVSVFGYLSGWPGGRLRRGAALADERQPAGD
jgi:RND superfamily putative drug exporter